MQFFCTASYTRSPDNDTHVLGDFQLRHGFFQFVSVLALNSAGNATRSWVVGHQHHIAACKGAERCQRCTFISALFLIDLDDDFLAFFNDFLDVDAAFDLGGRY